MAKGADVNVRNEDGMTPLIWAAFIGHLDIVKFLVDNGNGMDIDARDNKGCTALAMAVLMGKLEVVKILVAKGANVNKRNKGGATPLILAAGNRPMEAFLKQHGAKE